VTDWRSVKRVHGFSSDAPTSQNITADTAQTLLEIIRKASIVGITWIQIREKDLETRGLFDLARRAVAATRGTKTKILINDRLDVALATGAAGVHLGENSLPVETVVEWRRAAGRTEFEIGASCHTLEAARAAEDAGADYIFFGPVFATPSKAAFGEPQGIERLRSVCQAVKIPVLAIGGITLENAALCFAAGGAGVAAIRLFQESDDISAVVKSLRN
jgi:thiamine-phosphate pyrophosphorylase